MSKIAGEEKFSGSIYRTINIKIINQNSSFLNSYAGLNDIGYASGLLLASRSM
ncbi:MAG: hypothetical protein KDC69_11660 [Flavobacteriaceae bacterium]|nr:hypothetical protein [Flavobacteriaceae bacterium]